MTSKVQKSDFWSRRRAAVAAEEQGLEAEQASVEAAHAEADLENMPDEQVLAEYDLPDPDTLDDPEDIRDFLAKAPLQRLKTRALRRLWRLNPVLANLDGLLDYGEDFTDSAMVIENMQTAYQVGKGMLRHIEALAEAEAAKAEDATRDDDDDQTFEADVLAEQEVADEHVRVADVQTHDAVVPDAPSRLDDEDEAYAPVRPRRMTFTFEDQRT